jgi:phage-related protein (TIGR01555 family)
MGPPPPQGPVFDTLDKVFRVSQPMPGVIPATVANDAQKAMDDISGLYGSLVQSGGYNERLSWFGMPYLAQLTQRPEYRRPAEIISKTMTRKWIDLVSTGDDDKTDKIKALTAAIKKFQLQALFSSVAEQDCWYGRAHLAIDTGDSDKPDEMSTLLVYDKRKIKKGGLKGFRIVEPLWTYPAMYGTTNPLVKEFYRPSGWYVMGMTVHRSRLLTFVSREMPDILKPAYQFGGLSLSQMLKPYVDLWLRDKNSVSKMVYSFSTMVLETQMDEILNQGAATLLQKRIALYNATRDNQGLLAIAKDQETLTNVSAPLGTLDKLQAQSQEHMAAIAGIPLIVLFGITPTGLNATAEPEIRTFYDWCHAQQEHFFRPHLKTCIDLIQLNEFGEIDDEIDFKFNPLWQLDDAGLAAVQKTQADTAAVLIQEGVIAPEEERTRLAGDADSPYHGLEGPAPEPPIQAGDPDMTDPSEQIDKQAEEGSESGANSGT